MKLGKAFSDSLYIDQTLNKRQGSARQKPWWFGYGRILFFVTLFLFAFTILFVRLFHLTVVRGHEFRRLSDGNRTRELIRHAPRGNFLDRKGKPLTENIEEFRFIKPCGKDGDKEKFCTERLSKSEADKLRNAGLPLGSYLEADHLRRYLYPLSTVFVLGYTGELSNEELSEEYYNIHNYRRGDRMGRMGGELVFEELLRGKDGKELVEVDASGTIIRTLGSTIEIPGQDITLSIDIELSEKIAEAFPQGKKGAVIVSKPSTGEILALYSTPSFNPNTFSEGMTQAFYNALLYDSEKPLFNRATGGVYPPGSTFKIVTALAALEEKVINKSTLVEDIGIISIGSYEFPNWYFNQYGRTEGMVDIIKAIQRSNDIFFYKVGEWLGISKLAIWARKVGIGEPLGIELGGEASGLMPDPDWKKTRFNEEEDRTLRKDEWYLGDTYHVAIGQGYLLTTPLQVNAWTNVIANKGIFCKPTVMKTQSPSFIQGGARQQISGCKDLRINHETIQLITEGMKKACEVGGTGWPLFNFQVPSSKFKLNDESTAASSNILVPVACKTGTAEFGDPEGRTHAWFTAFAPLSDLYINEDNAKNILSGDPEISVTVLVEEGGEGSYVAAPVAKAVLAEWFSR